MNIDHLQYFCDAVELGSLAAAAKANKISAGAVSQAIFKLEEQIGHTLLAHKKKNFELSEHGRTLYKKGLELLKLYSAIKIDFDYINATEGELNFAAQHSIAEHLLAKVLLDYKIDHPQIRPILNLGHTSIVKEMLDKRSIDFAIMLDNVPLNNFNVKTLFEGQFVLYRKSKSADRKFLLTDDTPEVHFFKNSYRQIYNETPEVLLSVNSWSALKNMTGASEGIALIPEYLVTPSERQFIIKNSLGLRLPTYKIIAAWPINRPLSSKAHHFLEYLRQDFD